MTTQEVIDLLWEDVTIVYNDDFDFEDYMDKLDNRWIAGYCERVISEMMNSGVDYQEILEEITEYMENFESNPNCK